MSMPLSSGSFSSSSVRPARPPPNSVLNVSWKFWLMAANASRNRAFVVSSMRLIASPVAAIESTRSLRCVVRNTWRVSSSSNCSMAIMFTGPSRSILSRERGDGFFGGEARATAPASSSRRCRIARSRRRPARSPSSPLSSGSSAAIARGIRHRRAVPLHLLDFGEHLVERGLHGLGTPARRGARDRSRPWRARSRARATSARTASSVRTRLADRALSRASASACAAVTTSSSARTAARSSSSARMSASSARTPSAIASSRPRALLILLVRARRAAARRALRARARPPRAAALRASSADARSSSARRAPPSLPTRDG